MKRPAFQFYTADWRNNAKLRRCSLAARGVWMDVLCVLHDSDEYGVCRWPLVDIANAAGASIKMVRELVEKDVLKGSDKGAEPYIYTPRHAGKDGEPVTLVEPGHGPCWYSSRFVRDEWVRQRRGSATQFTQDNQPPNTKPMPTPKGGIGERQGYGSTTSSTTSLNTSEANASGGKPPKLTDPKEIIFGFGLTLLMNAGTAEKQARSFLGGRVKEYEDGPVVDALRDCAKAKPLQPLEWLAAALPPKGTAKSGKHAGFEKLNYHEGVNADGSLV